MRSSGSDHARRRPGEGDAVMTGQLPPSAAAPAVGRWLSALHRDRRRGRRRCCALALLPRQLALLLPLLLLPLLLLQLLPLAVAADLPPTQLAAQLSSSSTSGSSAAAAAAVHTVFLTDCTPYSDWQTLALVFAWRASGQRGRLTRVMCCAPEERRAYGGEALDLVTTHVAPSFTVHPKTGDHYAAYNKPAGVIDWLAALEAAAAAKSPRPGGDHHQPPPPLEEDFVLVLDSDMLLRRPFDPRAFNVSRGWASGARYDYLIGVDNDLARRHIPEVAPRADTLAGPAGRRADRVGGFYLIHRDDLKRVAPLWLKFTEDVRADPEAWHLSGDFYSKRAGDKPWISEMYGYAFGAASLGIRHAWDEESMVYPGYAPVGVPRLLHYGLLWHVDRADGTRWSFDKHWFTSFDMSVCPPWDLAIARPQYGLFPAPPLPRELRQNVTRAERYADLLAIEVVHTLNAALCERHLKRCPPGDELLAACRAANAAYEATARAARAMDAEMACADARPECRDWARRGECDKNAAYMHLGCRLSCKLCSRPEPAHVPGASGLARELARVSEELRRGGGKGGGSGGGEGAAAPKAAAAGGAAAAAVASPALQQQQHQQQLVPDVQLELSDSKPAGSGAAAAAAAATAALAAVPHGGAAGTVLGGPRAVRPRDGGGLEAALTPRPRARALTPKELRRRCYKRSDLSMRQVKECMRAADRGAEWTAGEEEEAGTAAAAAAAAAGGGNSGSSGDGGEDMAKTAAAAAAAERSGQAPAPAPAAAARGGGRVTLLGALMAWFGIVGMFLSVLPRLYHRSRRRPSGPPDPSMKLSV